MNGQIDREHPPKNVEVIHSLNFTIVISPWVSGRQDVRQLAEELKNGIPAFWVALKEPRIEESEDIEGTTSFSGRWVDSADKPRFFAKVRSLASPSWLRYAKGLAKDETSIIGFTKATHYAFNSLLNEIYLVPKIKAVLASDKVEKLARKYDIEAITFIEPLIGLINSTTGQKIMVYDFIRGNNFREKEIDFVYRLHNLIKASGIYPSDFDSNQLMVDKSNPKRLYLIDAEGYHREDR